MKLLVTIDLKDKYLNKVREIAVEAGVDLEICKALEEEKQLEEVRDADIMITGGGANRKLLENSQQLSWIQTWSAGVEAYMLDEIIDILEDKKIRLASMSGIHGDPIAEHVMGFIINHTRELYKFYDLQKESRWERKGLDQSAGKTIVIVGTGSIGMEVARRAKAFKMNTIGVRRNVDKEVQFIDSLYSNDELHTALNKGDFIVVTVPLTEETEGMFAEEEFSVMKENAFFVNIARGGVVDEAALINALQEDIIGGAGLDVFEEEPLPADSPLYQLDNVYITPHVSGSHPQYNQNAVEVFNDNLQRYLAGKELRNIVDYEREY